MARLLSSAKWLDRLLAIPSTSRGKRLAKKPQRFWLEELENRLAPAVTLSIATANVIEPGPGGTANMDFTATRSGDLNSQLTVGYTTVAGTAQANVDFTPTSGTTTFAAGSETALIQIPVFGPDAYSHPNLSFSVQLTGIVSVVGGPVTLGGKTDFAAGSRPAFVALADLNRDGKPDMIVANAGDNTVSVLVNTTPPGAAAVTFAAQQTFSTGTQPVSVAVADLNLDGIPDLIVANNSAAGSVSVLLGATIAGSNTIALNAHVDFNTGSAPTSVAVGDLNGDGKPDLVVANSGSDNVSVLLNTTPPGAITPIFAGHVDFTTGTSPHAVAIGDLNGDGVPDVIVANSGSASVSLLLNTTTPGATVPSFGDKQDFTTGANPVSVAVGDLNGDGERDLAVADATDNMVSVLLNTTSPGSTTFSFTAKQDFQTKASPQSVVIRDLNGDGKPDLVVANSGSGANTASVLLNTMLPGAAVPTFAAQQTFATASGPVAVAVGDINGDGKPDLALADIASGANAVSVLLNTTTLVEATNVSAFPGSQFPASQTISAGVADINGDGKPDIVVGANHGSTATVLLNTTVPGATTPSFAAPATFATGYAVNDLALADFNGDGLPDLVTANVDDNTVSVLLNTTAPGALVPSFAAHTDFGPLDRPRMLAVGDINGDGVPDLVVANSGGFVAVLLNTTAPGAATPSFAAPQDITTPGGPYGIVVADFNGDGVPDVAVVDNPGVSVLLNTTPPGSATVSLAAPQNFATAGGAQHIAVGDLNGDGKLDLAVANQSSNSATVLINTTVPGASAVSFATTSLAVGNGTYRVGIQDMNGDGKPDVTLITFGVGNANILEFFNTTTLGATTASFAPAQPLTTNHPHNLAFADLNGDGRPDLILPTQYSTSVSIALNTPAMVSPTGASATAALNETVQFSAAGETVSENAGTFSIPVNLSLASPVDTTIPFTLGGTAVSGTNYKSVTASPLVIPAGQTSGTVTGTLIDDGVFSANKTLTITLGIPTNAILGGATVNTLTIQESSPPLTVSFAAATQSVKENDGSFTATINLSAAAPADVTIPFTLSGTAVSGTHYGGVTASPLVIPAGKTSATITGTLIDDNKFDASDTTLILTLGTPSDNAILGTTTADTITIQETDPPPTATFASATQSVKESDSAFSVTVNLSATSNVATTIPFTLSGTAVSGANYSNVTASPLVIAAGQTSATITGKLLDDGKFDAVDRTVTLTLGAPTNALLGAAAADTVTIQESDPAPTVAFAAAAQTITQNAGTFTVPVNLSAASNAATTIPFTVGGTAVAGTDFSGLTASPLVIPAGQTSGAITGTLLINPAANPSRALTFTLGTPTNALLGGLTTHTLTIQSTTSATKLVLSAPSSASAGFPFIITVTALTPLGTTATSYNGTIHFTSTDPAAVLPADIPLTGGFGFFQAALKTAGSQTITVADAATPTLSGATGPIAVSPAPASSLAFSNVPAAATTGSPFNVAVSALDSFGNIVTGYTGHVHFTSSDAAAVLPADTTLTSGTGTFSITLKSGGNQTVTATDTLATNPIIGGTSTPILTRGLTVSSFAPTATGFTAAFSKPFVAADLALYGTGLHTIQDITLVGAHVGPISGSVIVDPSSASITFNATANALALMNNFASVVLPDDTYTVTLLSGSGSSGFLDMLGAGLDGTNTGGHADYSTTFTTSYQAKKAPVLAIPDFARGPDRAHPVKVPGDTGAGIPITLYNAVGVTDVSFTLSYNPTLLDGVGALGGANSDATNPSSFFALVGAPTLLDAMHAQATFLFHDPTPRSGTVVLGDVQASVAASAAGSYKAKELLGLTGIVINNGGITGAVGASSVHVNAYLGDVTGNGTIDGLDVATASNVAQGRDTGFAAYPLLDPSIVGDPALDFSVDAGDVSDLAALTVRLPTPAIPTIPTGLTITPGGPDPTLSLGDAQRLGDKEKGRHGESSTSPVLLVSLSPGLIVTVPVLLDHPHPDGSTGMTEAILALTYDPSILSVSASDITLGSIPSAGAGWQLSSVVDPTTGQIGIELYSTTPITATQAGSLVNIAFHVRTGEPGGVSPRSPATSIQLVNSVLPNGQQFVTQVDDAQGPFVLSPGMDRLIVQTGRDLPARATPVNVSNRLAPRAFEIGILPLLNTLLFQESPRQRAADRLFAALAPHGDANSD